MPVTTTHSDYQKYSTKWSRCRDAVEGEDAIKAAGEKYLPRLSGQEPNTTIALKSSREGINTTAADKDYKAYKSRAFWYNASARTVDGLSGLIFRKPPIITIPDSMKTLTEDITMSGMSLEEFAEQVTDEVIAVARCGVLVEYPIVDSNSELMVSEVESMGLRPYWSFYAAESITNWRSGRINNQNILTFVVLKEDYSVEDPDDEFKQKPGEQYRVLDLYEKVYRQRIYRKEGKEWNQFGDDIFPLMDGKSLLFIPFEFLGISANPIKVQKSPIQDLVDVNLSHYRTTADLENGAHWTGVPTPIFIGEFISDDDDDEITEVKLGSTTGINLALGGDAKFLEFTGQGLEALEKRAEKKEQMMAVLGARILAQEKKMVESAETASIHRAGESSVLASIANALSSVLTRLLEITRDWSTGGIEEVKVELNTDFTPTQMTAQELTAIMKMWQSGGFSSKELYWNLQKGEMIRSDKSFDAHQEELEEDGPGLGELQSEKTGGVVANNE